MIRFKYSIICDYCEKEFCDSLNVKYFDNHEIPFKLQEAKKMGWGITPGGDFSVHVLCDKCKERGITCLDICDKLEQERKFQI